MLKLGNFGEKFLKFAELKFLDGRIFRGSSIKPAFGVIVSVHSPKNCINFIIPILMDAVIYPSVILGRLRSVQRLCQMHGLNLLAACQACNGA